MIFDGTQKVLWFFFMPEDAKQTEMERKIKPIKLIQSRFFPLVFKAYWHTSWALNLIDTINYRLQILHQLLKVVNSQAEALFAANLCSYPNDFNNN